jgi:hypothetical protein
MKAAGVPFGEICKALGVPRGTVTHWLYGQRARDHRTRPPEPSRCPRCAEIPGLPQDQESYSYLFGLYLGDGHLVTRAKVPVLRISCTATWPGLITQCETAMLSVLAKRVQRVRQTGCVNVQSYSAHWPCLLPQHGPGGKHERSISLTDWQRRIIDAHHDAFIRGLFHSDGCRVINKVTRAGRTHRYPRYMFSNESKDIMRLCQTSLDRLGLGWRMCRPNLLSVARRADVHLMDQYVGPKS